MLTHLHGRILLCPRDLAFVSPRDFASPETRSRDNYCHDDMDLAFVARVYYTTSGIFYHFNLSLIKIIAVSICHLENVP
jgi:hypothetical protein